MSDLFKPINLDNKEDTTKEPPKIEIDKTQLQKEVWEIHEEVQSLLNEVKNGLSKVLSGARQISPAIDRNMLRLREQPGIASVRGLLDILQQDINLRARREVEQMIVSKRTLMEALKSEVR